MLDPPSEESQEKMGKWATARLLEKDDSLLVKLSLRYDDYSYILKEERPDFVLGDNNVMAIINRTELKNHHIKEFGKWIVLEEQMDKRKRKVGEEYVDVSEWVCVKVSPVELEK